MTGWIWAADDGTGTLARAVVASRSRVVYKRGPPVAVPPMFPSLPRSPRAAGTLSAVGAYTAWGLFPVYWKALRHVEPLQILAHRIVWSMVFAAALVTLTGRWAEVITAVKSRRTVLSMLASTSLIGTNWFLYIWAVNSGHVLESSLGYFINPLVNVVLGLVFLGERLRILQWACVGLAGVGVGVLAYANGKPPWISLILAVSFGIYGLLRKTARVESLVGLALETALLCVPACIFLGVREAQGTGALFHVDVGTDVLLMLAGVVTATPLLWFAHGARRMPLSTLGLLQYISPTGQLLLAVFLYGEAFTRTHAFTFGCIWVALVVYSVETTVRARLAQPAAAPERA